MNLIPINYLLETEAKLRDMGAKLRDPPEALSQRISLLDAVEGLMSNLAQTPPYPIWHSLLLIKEALIGESFFQSSDINVKMSSLTCIHELIRILAPVYPYDDDKMKEIFTETVKAFEHLSSGSGRFFNKACFMLCNVAVVRSGLVLLDLGCESLVARMFQILLRDTQSDYPALVVLAMESLMTELIMEAKEPPVDLLRPLVNQVKSPPSASLATKVLQNCSTIAQLQTVIDQLQRDLDSRSRAGRQRRLPRRLAEDYVFPEASRRRRRERGARTNETREGLVGSRRTADQVLASSSDVPNPPDASSSRVPNPPDASSSRVPAHEPYRRVQCSNAATVID